MNSPENQNSPEALPTTEHYAVPLDAVDDDMWHDVMNIYYSNAFEKDAGPTEDDLLMMPLENAFQFAGYRIGSRFSPHSKLQPIFPTRGTSDVTFAFHVNETLKGGMAEEAEEAKKSFERDLDVYLQNHPQAVTYETPEKK